METQMFKCYAWDYEDMKRVGFESVKPHCSSCLMDEEFGYAGGFADDPCCCAHQLEYEVAKAETAK